MKRKIILGFICSATVLTVLSVYCVNTFASTEFNSVKSFVNIQKNENDKDKIADEIVLSGKNIAISQNEINESMRFYIAQGEDKKKAKEDAVKCLKEYNALYSNAIKKGYYVTEKEVDEYIEQLKKQLKESENSDDVEAIISSYGDEKEYWAKMKDIYMKRLVVEKYTKDLLESFNSSYKGEIGTEKYENDWENYFNKIKSAAVKKECFKIVNEVYLK